MAHEIDFTTQAQGSAMFAYQPAWHGFGTVVQEAQTSADALRLAISEADRNKSEGGLPLGLKLFHTAGSLSKRVQKAKELLGVINDSHDDFANAARAMLAKPLNTQQVSDYFSGLVENRSDRSRGKVLTAMWDRFALPTNEGGFKSNVWTAYNAASEWADHELRVTGKGNVRMERKFRSCLFGSSHSFKERAWAAACDLVTVA